MFLWPCANLRVKRIGLILWATASELEDKPQEQADGEIPANLLLTFNGSSDKVKQNVCLCYKGSIVLLDKSVRRLELI